MFLPHCLVYSSSGWQFHKAGTGQSLVTNWSLMNSEYMATDSPAFLVIHNFSMHPNVCYQCAYIMTPPSCALPWVGLLGWALFNLPFFFLVAFNTSDKEHHHSVHLSSRQPFSASSSCLAPSQVTIGARWRGPFRINKTDLPKFAKTACVILNGKLLDNSYVTEDMLIMPAGNLLHRWTVPAEQLNKYVSPYMKHLQVLSSSSQYQLGDHTTKLGAKAVALQSFSFLHPFQALRHDRWMSIVCLYFRQINWTAGW